jgi:tRNA (mo5U34)-methyltransferase
MQISALNKLATEYHHQLADTKSAINDPNIFWYPYGTLFNFGHLDKLLTGPNRDLDHLIQGLPIADVGAADGEASFFLESHGHTVDIVDYPPTNCNGLRGARALKEALQSGVTINEVDLDSQFRWPRERYGLTIFLGILYHLKNPFYALESMAKVSSYAIVSTRIARYASDKKTRVAEMPMAYLLDATECNNDATNFWIFSDAGLKRLFHRTGWEIADYMTVGNTKNSDPASAAGDERAFALLKSRYV